MAVLVVGGGDNPRIVKLGSSPITVGRAIEHGLSLDHPDVSRVHCRIEPIGDDLYRVVDLGSTNGTFVNGEPVRSMALETGDRIIVGQVTLTFADSDEDLDLEMAPGEEVFPWKPASTGDFSAITRIMSSKPRPADPPILKGTDYRLLPKLKVRPTTKLKLGDILPQLTHRGQHVGSELDLANLQLTMLGEILRCTAFERAILLLHDERTGLVQPVLSSNVEFEQLSGEVQQYIQRLTKESIEDQQPVYRNSASPSSRDPASPFPSDPKVQSTLCFPLTVPVRSLARERRQHRRQRRALGAIYLDSSTTIECLSESDRRTLEVVAAQACTALQNAQLHYQATTDPMTRLNNRLVLWQVLRDELEWSQETGAPLGIILLDLDHFKRINDTHGHLVGDEVLKRLARRLTRVLRADDYAFRWGGEEFLILIPGTQPDAVLSVTNKIAQTISSSPFGELRLRVTVSMGVALYPDHGSEAEDLIQHADIALYHAKASGRNRTRIYDPSMDQRLSAHDASHWTDPHSPRAQGFHATHKTHHPEKRR